MSGFGTAPLGTTPYGLGTPATAPVVGGTPQNDSTLVAQSGRFIDPLTKQYVIDANGRATGMSTVPQLVQLTVGTLLGSSAMTELGLDLLSIEDAGDDLEAQIRTRVASAFASLIAQKFVAVLAVDVERFGNGGGQVGARVRIHYTDLTTGIDHTTTLG